MLVLSGKKTANKNIAMVVNEGASVAVRVGGRRCTVPGHFMVMGCHAPHCRDALQNCSRGTGKWTKGQH